MQMNPIYIFIECKNHKWKLLSQALWYNYKGHMLWFYKDSPFAPEYRTADFECLKCGIKKSGYLKDMDIFDADTMKGACINDHIIRHYVLAEIEK
jgi:hypothetical protein